MFIYKIVDNTTSNIYIGSTKGTLSIRLSKHKSCFKKWFATGKGNYCRSYECLKNGDYKIELLEEVEKVEDLKKREQHYMNLYDCVNNNKSYVTAEDKSKRQLEATKRWIDKNREKWNEISRINVAKHYETHKEEKKKKNLDRYYYLKEATRLRNILL